MASKWLETTIGELIAKQGGSVKTGPFGTTLKASEYSMEGVPLISVREVGYGTLRLDESTPRVPRTVTNRLPEYILRTGDIVFGRKGAVDRSVHINEEQEGWFLGSDGIRLRLPETCDSRFVAYQVRNPRTRSWLIQHATGTTMPSLNQGVIQRVPIVLPPIEEQRAIAHILSTLDDKIELNRRMNETLEEMARAIFKSWFVDFDPVRTKVEGRDPGLPEHIADLFPDRFEASELGEIPAGWEVGAIESLCESITSGGTPARMNPVFWDGGTIPWFKSGELLDGPLLDSKEHITEAALAGSACKLWPAGTILFALYASPTVGRLGVLTRPGTSNQAAAGLVVKPAYDVPFLRRLLLQAREKLQSIAVGAAQQNINQGVLKSHRVVVPDIRVVTAFSKLVAASDERQVSLAEQSRTLAAIRDALLPRLISGELRVGEAGRMVEAAVRDPTAR